MMSRSLVRLGIDLSRETHGLAGDRADQSMQEHDTSISLGLVMLKMSEAQEAMEFATKKQAGVANLCSDCGGEISEARRRAAKRAIRCFDCQKTLEAEVALAKKVRL